jgi:amino acid transporter
MTLVTYGSVAFGFIVAAVIFVRRIKRDSPRKWHARRPTVRERIIAGVWLLLFLFALANYYADWRLLRGYDNWAVLGVFLTGLFLIERMTGVSHT